MKPRSDADEVVASRTFERDDGSVEFIVFKPCSYPDPAGIVVTDDPPWRCDCAIFFPDGEVKRSYAVGIDGIQALLLAFASARNLLRHVGDGTPTLRPPLRWLGENDLGLSINRVDDD